jgi:hypothetical protein
MANIYSVHSVGDSLMTFLRSTYPEPLRTDYPCEFRLISSGELEENKGMGTAVTLYLYRIDIDKYGRNTPSNKHPTGNPKTLSLCLYYIFIIWADSPLVENTIATWIMWQLHQHPVMDRSILSSSGGWLPDEQILIVPIEMSNEDLLRMWEAMSPSYRLSLPYTARIIRIAPEKTDDPLPVVATRYRFGEMENVREDKGEGRN